MLFRSKKDSTDVLTGSTVPHLSAKNQLALKTTNRKESDINTGSNLNLPTDFGTHVRKKDSINVFTGSTMSHLSAKKNLALKTANSTKQDINMNN